MLNKADLVRFSKIVGEGNMKTDEPMSKYSSFRVGGPADVLLDVDSVAKLQAILIPYLPLKLLLISQQNPLLSTIQLGLQP